VSRSNNLETLLPQHLDDLGRSGLSSAQIDACGFRSEDRPGEVSKLLNWDGPAKALGPCLVIPFPDVDGKPTGYVRVKPDRPRTAEGGRVVKYESPKGQRNRVYFPPGVGDVLKDPGSPVLVTEGEKKAAKAAQEGFACLGLVGVWGWLKKRPRDAYGKAAGPFEVLDELAGIPWDGRPVTLVFDSDAADRPNVALAERHLAEALDARGAVVRVAPLPAGPGGAKAGLDDYLVTHGADALRQLLAQATEPERPLPTETPLPEERPWPAPLAQQAYYGLAGDVVRALDPESEADPVALLIQTLVAFGNIIGRSQKAEVEGTDHYCNLFAVLVGQTSKARKGSSWSRVEALFRAADPEWADRRIVSGLSSGEGLVWCVRDPIRAREKVKTSGQPTTTREYEADPGEPDKRLLVVEPEWAVVLRQIERQGNTLSTVLRQAWDQGDLRTLTKNSPARATGAHISIIGHITADELHRYLSTTEAASGFGNRNLWACVRRSKCLPEGGNPVDLTPLIDRLKDAINHARAWWTGLAGGLGQHTDPADLIDPGAHVMVRDDAAREIWNAIYPELSEGKPGLHGAMVARAEAQALRLAMVYALLDQSSQVRAEHLLAALAITDYVGRSVRYVFGDCLGDPLADEVLQLLRACPDGLTRNEIRNHFQRNQSSDRIGRALGLLLKHKLVRREQEQTGGRPAERWIPIR
jgi:hypothetical protein